MANDLTKPLGLAKPRRRGRLIAGAVLGLAAIAGIAVSSSLIFGDPGDGEAIVVGAIDQKPDAQAPPAVPPAASSQSGGGLTELVPDGTLSDIDPTTVASSSVDTELPRQPVVPRSELTENGPYGPLPRIGPDGTRPLDAYAHPMPAAAPANFAHLAIVVTGIGDQVSDAGAALTALPGAVTLAFSPYGENLTDLLAGTRGAGHEVLLQIPLEPYNYPNNDPGPHTLTVDAPAQENIDRLHWLMSRITNYVGMINFLGARFSSDPAALEPVLTEIGDRGLLYLDDGTSHDSQAEIIAGERTPFIQADIVLDAVTEPASIDAMLDEAATMAKQQGYAVAVGTAFPVTIERIAAFAKTAEERGIAIVPVTALLGADKTL